MCLSRTPIHSRDLFAPRSDSFTMNPDKTLIPFSYSCFELESTVEFHFTYCGLCYYIVYFLDTNLLIRGKRCFNTNNLHVTRPFPIAASDVILANDASPTTP